MSMTSNKTWDGPFDIIMSFKPNIMEATDKIKKKTKSLKESAMLSIM